MMHKFKQRHAESLTFMGIVLGAAVLGWGLGWAGIIVTAIVGSVICVLADGE